MLTPDTGPTVHVGPLAPDPHGVVRAAVDGLRPSTNYRFAVVVDDQTDSTRGVGTFRTPGLGAQSFRVALTACARVGSNGRVFDAIAAADPLLYVEMGDIHYANIGRNAPDAFRAAYDRLLTERRAGSAVPTGPDRLRLGRPRLRTQQRRQHLTVTARGSRGVPRGRSARRGAARRCSDQPGVHDRSGAIRDDRQPFGTHRRLDARGVAARWLLEELTTASRTHALVVWVNSVPWIAEPRDGGDNWNGYPDERRLIANTIAEAQVDNLIMVSGDAHMVALDDGSNSDYSSEGGAGFPVFHAAPLDRPSSIKGGPYSDGTFVGAGQFGLLDIADDGETISVTTTGTNWQGEILVQQTFTFDVP